MRRRRATGSAPDVVAAITSLQFADEFSASRALPRAVPPPNATVRPNVREAQVRVLSSIAISVAGEIRPGVHRTSLYGDDDASGSEVASVAMTRSGRRHSALRDDADNQPRRPLGAAPPGVDATLRRRRRRSSVS